MSDLRKVKWSVIFHCGHIDMIRNGAYWDRDINDTAENHKCAKCVNYEKSLP